MTSARKSDAWKRGRDPLEEREKEKRRKESAFPVCQQQKHQQILGNRLPLGKAARTTRTVSAGISGIGWGFNMAGLQLSSWERQTHLYSTRYRLTGFRHQYHCEDEPIA
jgi:hypothetical protein